MIFWSQKHSWKYLAPSSSNDVGLKYACGLVFSLLKLPTCELSGLLRLLYKDGFLTFATASTDFSCRSFIFAYTRDHNLTSSPTNMFKETIKVEVSIFPIAISSTMYGSSIVPWTAFSAAISKAVHAEPWKQLGIRLFGSLPWLQCLGLILLICQHHQIAAWSLHVAKVWILTIYSSTMLST